MAAPKAPVTKKPAAKKPTAKKPAARKPARARATVAKKPAAAKTSPAARKTSAPKTAAAKKPMARKRADLGAPITGFLAKQPADKRAILERLRLLIRSVAPGTSEQLKWGMPMFSLGRDFCSLAAFKQHVSIVFFNVGTSLADPDGLLEGSGKTARHLKLRSASDIDEAQIRRWLAAAANAAR
jgi:hypothetical protein